MGCRFGPLGFIPNATDLARLVEPVPPGQAGVRPDERGRARGRSGMPYEGNGNEEIKVLRP